ncbi:MAG: hypothetical protein JWO76_2565 [Nocardioides sp.]|nr:hypothetical protein [Nocardioides sp.]
MGDAFERAQAGRRENADDIDRGKHRSNVTLAIVLGIFAAGITVVALVQLSPVGLLAGLVALVSPYAWLRGDRARVDEISPEHRDAYAKEFGWSVLAVALLAGGYALFIAAMVNGW